ncbi:hypothetical protein DPM19_20275 [Actinomadura craniellae]|uniref:Uncharacterized protein n=1 Tax=Actinomadura craniellae TaxID=2231787 RepID=A0A365H309_9ACTN|nr:hypothetical protein [Actinomadura craniellae]RAY13406.1 hypothetical protein DPM19_20275 [Actinomadura craniellae]
MSSQAKVAVGGVVVAILALILIPTFILKLIVLGVIAIPVAGYLMLDPSQRRRVRAQGRKRLGS